MYDFIIQPDGTYWRKSTLAQRLDTRRLSLGDPSPNDVPHTINPMEFLLKQLMPNLVVVRIKQNCMQNPLLSASRFIKDAIPPEQAVLLYTEVSPCYDKYLDVANDNNYQIIPVAAQASDISSTGNDNSYTVRPQGGC